MPNTQPGRASLRGRKDMYRRRRLGASLALVALCAASFLAWRAYHFWNSPLTVAAETSAGPSTPGASLNTRFTVLITGADDRPGEPGRSDTILLAFVDLDAGSVKLLSIPRDAYVQIPGHGWDKVNAAYAYGREGVVQQTLAPLLKIPIDYTFAVNMQGFEKVVDAIGGVDINVEEKMDYDDPYDDPPLHIHLAKGQQHLSGLDALHYVRFRHDSRNDWGRMQRQQNFLQALLRAAERPGNLSRLPTLIKLGLDNVRTNMSPGQLTRLALLAKDKLSAEGITGATLAGDDLWTAEGYYVVLHFQEMRDRVRQLAGITSDPTMPAQDRQDVATYQAALPQGSSTYDGLLATAAAEAAKTAQGKAGATGKLASSGPAQAAPGHTPWQLVVVKGTGGTQSTLLDTLKADGFQILAVHEIKGVQGTTIVWYNGPKEAADRLRALLPNASFLHPAPGPGDPPLKLILG